MTKYFIILFSIIFVLSCAVNSSTEIIEQKIIINDSDRSLIDGLNEPVVDYILLKDGEEYIEKTDLLLSSENGTYVINLELISGSVYSFQEFTIKTENITEYVLDYESQDNIDGFQISVDGVFSVTPKVYLKRVTGVVFDNLEYEMLSVEISTDESSYLDPVELTFKISSNIEGATFQLYKYTIYWVTGPELNQNEIFDMDTGDIYDPLIEGDEDPWGSGKFKIVTTNSQGENVFVVGFSDEWSKKHIHLTLD